MFVEYDVEQARNIFHRGLERSKKDRFISPQKNEYSYLVSTDLRLQYAYFEEAHDKVDLARQLYVQLKEQCIHNFLLLFY